jgi:integrase
MPRPAREIPWLDVRENGAYYVFWYDKENGRTERFSLRTKDAAEAKAGYITFLSEGKGLFEKLGTSLTVDKALDQYELEHVNHKCADPRRQRDAIKNLKAHFGEAPLSAVDIPSSRKYAETRRSGSSGGGSRRKPAPASDSTIRRELVTLVAAANHARKWKRITPNEMPSVELPTEQRPPAEWYTKDEVRLILSTASGDLQRFCRILYYTGARRRAIENLTVGQVNFEAKQIRLLGDGQKETKKRRPVVPIFPEIEADLRALVAKARDGRLFSGDMYRRYRRHCEAIGLDHKANPHIMRHTRATLMLMDGVDPYAVSRLLGDTLATIDRVYGHHSPEHLNQTGGGL